MHVIGLTGGIATGKTAVARLLQNLGAEVIEADQITRKLVEPGGELLEKIVAAFGNEYLEQDGSLNRTKLGELVFRNQDARQILNRITHPPLREAVCAELDRLRGLPEQPKLVVVEAAVLFEMQAEDIVDEVWVTSTPKEVQMRRLADRGLSPEEARARIEAQPSASEFERRADLVIDCSCSLESLRDTLKALLKDRFGLEGDLAKVVKAGDWD